MFDVFRRNLTVKRKALGSYVNGLWVESQEDSVFTIKASVQATDAEILQTLPEGYRTKESYTLFTDSKLQTSVVSKTNPDVVTIEDEPYQVVRVTPWKNLSYPTAHYEILVVRENVDVN